ncbi:MAG: RNA-directed DNA polymerase [Prevotellaceae bacterium]|jgi:hypothetical protein|nr:RNA-directed DNA polymerase [Prevotellaceae bacterium]
MTITHEQLLEDLYIAYLEARRHKRSTCNQLRFELQQERELLELHEAIVARAYMPRRSVAFMVHKPVMREVFCADFADRVVHHLIFNYINPLFEQLFIPTSFSCRKGKGTLYGIRTLQHHMEQCTKGYTREAYILKLDIQGYFMNISRRRLYGQLEDVLLRVRYQPITPNVAEVWDDRLDYDLVLYLLRVVVFNDPVKGCLVKGSRSEWNGLPPSKSLFNRPEGVGLPIGNLTSQLFSNIYLNQFDHWMMEELNCAYYGRYVDDFYIVHHDAGYLKSLIPKVREYLKAELGLTLHPAKVYFQSCQRGCSFLGAFVKGKQCYAGRRLRSHFKMAVAAGVHPCADEQQVVARMNSYLGLLRHYLTRTLRKKQVERLNKDGKYVVSNGYVKITRKKRKQ